MSPELTATVAQALLTLCECHNRRQFGPTKLEYTDDRLAEDTIRVFWYVGQLPPELIDPVWIRTKPLDNIADAVELTFLQRLQRDWTERHPPKARKL